MKFSQRYGYTQVRETIQFESIDGPLRNKLWNLLDFYVWSDTNSYGEYTEDLLNLCKSLMFGYFNRPIDEINEKWWKERIIIKRYFFECEWYEVYDFIEFILNKYSDHKINKFIELCNSVLTAEMSAYRIVDKRFLSITNDEEIKEIEEAIVSSDDSVTMHMRRALELLSDRNAPDYRNSIKESISAVESLVADIIRKKGTLGQLLKELEQKIGLHPALKDAFNKLYGYTNDSNGIRHAIFDSDNLSFEDAKFFLVACSAFINYIKIKIK
jgi:hypothetical protein